MKMNDYKTIDEYISNFPDATQKILQKIRTIANDAAPGAVETINYGIPTLKLKNTNLIHFAGYVAHIGFYPTPPLIEIFKNELKEYETSKGAVKFPLDKPIPYDLIKTMTEKRVQILTK